MTVEKNHWFLYVIPPALVAAIMMTVYAIKGFYPFGSATIIYGDMGQGFIPICYHLYDVIHHGKSLFWDPFLGTGSNIFGSEALSGMFSPVSWLVALPPRDNIPYFMSFLLVIRMALMAVSSVAFFNVAFPGTRAFWKISISVMYAFCGFVLVYYTNMMWLDSAILFPLLLLTLKRLFDADKKTGFILVLSANLIACYYIAFMVLLFLFFSSGVLLIYYVPRERRQKALWTLGLCILTALAATSFVTIPACLQAVASKRMSGAPFRTLLSIRETLPDIGNKALFFFFAAATWVSLAKLAAPGRTDKKAVAAFGLLLVLTASQVFVESINLIWHAGSYNCFPLRFGFIPLYLLLAGCAYCFSGNPECSVFARTRTNLGAGLLALAAFVYALYLGMKCGPAINASAPAFGISPALAMTFFATSLLLALSLWLLLKLKAPRIKYILIGILLASECGLHAMWFIGVPAPPQLSKKNEAWIFTSLAMKKDFPLEPDSLSRYKNVDPALNSNYPLILGAPSMSGWTHLIRAGQQEAFQQLGYSIVYTRLLDRGGTLFSDMVLSVDRYLTESSYPSNLFAKIGVSQTVNLYENKNPLPFGLLFSYSNEPLAFKKNASLFDNQNRLYRTLFNRKDRIIETRKIQPEPLNAITVQVKNEFRCRPASGSTPGILEFKIPVAGLTWLYLDADIIPEKPRIESAAPHANPDKKPVPQKIKKRWKPRTQSVMTVRINGQPLFIPTLGNSTNLAFPEKFNNGILPLGLFSNETVKLELTFTTNLAFRSLLIGDLSVAKLQELPHAIAPASTLAVMKGNHIRFTVPSARNDQSLFIPITFDPGWKGRLNDRPVSIKKVFGAFMAVPLAEGANTLELRFVPKGFAPGLLLSALAWLFWLVVLLPSRCPFITEPIVLQRLAYFVYWPVYLAGILLVYIIPVFALLLRS